MLLAVSGEVYEYHLCAYYHKLYWTAPGAGAAAESVPAAGIVVEKSATSGGGVTSGSEEDGGISTATSTESTGADDVWFSTYHIKGNGERMQVLGCLEMVQLKEFSRLLERLKTRAGSRRGDLVLLTEAEKRIKAVRSTLRVSLARSPSARNQKILTQGPGQELQQPALRRY